MLIAYLYLLALGNCFTQQILTVQRSPKFKSLNRYFKQNDPETNDTDFNVLDDIGLNPNYSWPEVLEELTDLNRQFHHKQYKLFLLQRHGEGYHNIAPDLVSNWTCHWQLVKGNGEMEWYDAQLTPTGIDQITSLSNSIAREIEHRNMPLPHSYYVSPLRRTLQTWNLTWPSITSDRPVVKEYARETYGIGTESQRHSKKYIEAYYPFATFEPGFTEEDELWEADLHESTQHRNYRAAQLLSDIFVHDSNMVISVVSHSGLIKSILNVIGHRKWELKTGQMIPVVIKVDYSKRGKQFNLSKPWGKLPDYCQKPTAF
ncbi:histidine phosphatase superfamily [Scheffersomyces xylosifermentans]|uniref:histidine phosphatase superfamily n=1 Tax=Scheffersomyces xylosifermentans TaxID=1304137 RepID=UPI00315D138C